MVEVSVDSVRVSLVSHQRVVILKEKNADRYLPIWIGPAEAEAIAVKLQDVATPRPLTHDLLYSVIKALDVRINFIAVTELRNDTFYAILSLNAGGRERELTIDCRPSDAIALAVRAGVPIYVEEEVLERAGICLDKETGKPSRLAGGLEALGKISEEELKKLSAFEEVVKDLNLEDLGKGKNSAEKG